MNTELLIKLSAALRAGVPDGLLVDPSWIEQAAGRTICPTHFALAGWALAIAAGPAADGAAETIAEWAALAPHGDLLAVAIERLGISIEAAAALFYRSTRGDGANQFRSPAAAALPHGDMTTTLGEAANTIDHLMATGEIDWIAANPHWTTA